VTAVCWWKSEGVKQVASFVAFGGEFVLKTHLLLHV